MIECMFGKYSCFQSKLFGVESTYPRPSRVFQHCVRKIGNAWSIYNLCLLSPLSIALHIAFHWDIEDPHHAQSGSMITAFENVSTLCQCFNLANLLRESCKCTSIRKGHLNVAKKPLLTVWLSQLSMRVLIEALLYSEKHSLQAPNWWQCWDDVTSCSREPFSVPPCVHFRKGRGRECLEYFVTLDIDHVWSWLQVETPTTNYWYSWNVFSVLTWPKSFGLTSILLFIFCA